MGWSRKMSGTVWQTNRYQHKTYGSVRRVWVVGEEPFVLHSLNKLIMWTTESDLGKLLIANPSSRASSPISFQTLPSLISTYSSFLNGGLWTSVHSEVRLLLPCHVPGVPLLLRLADSLGLFVSSCQNFGVTPLTLLLSERFVEKKAVLYCKSLPWFFLQEDFLCCLLLIVMLCLNLSTNPENSYLPAWLLTCLSDPIASNSSSVWLRIVEFDISSLSVKYKRQSF